MGLSHPGAGSGPSRTLRFRAVSARHIVIPLYLLIASLVPVAFVVGQQDAAVPRPIRPRTAHGTARSAATPERVSAGLGAPIPVGTPIHRIVVTGNRDGQSATNLGTVSGQSLSCEANDNAVYCNTLGTFALSPPGSWWYEPIADDIITLAGVPGCSLDRYAILVTGDKSGDGSGVGPFSVDFGLFDNCPGAGGLPVDGTDGHADLPDAGYYLVVFEVPQDAEIPIPNSFWLQVRFSRPEAGIVGGAPALRGFSADQFDYGGYPCATRLAYPGFAAGPHASFYAEVYVRGQCQESFPGYRNSYQSRRDFTPGAGVWSADDITLGVPQCRAVAYEVSSGGGALFGVNLRTSLSDNDPEANVIAGTEGLVLPSGIGEVNVGRVEIDPPVLLPSTFYIAFKTITSSGPILACKEADIGATANQYWVYDSIYGVWVPVLGSHDCWHGFDVTVYCEGSPPMGACCDMVLTDNRTCIGGPNEGNACLSHADCRVCVGGLSDGSRCWGYSECPEGRCPHEWKCVGESVCRDVPEMNCPSSVGGIEGLWTEGARCGGVCVGGDNAGRDCTRQADCPGGSCDGGPFVQPCGLATCCEPVDDDTCENLTERQCLSIEPLERRRIYARGSFCETFECPFNACKQRGGDCSVGHAEAGCAQPDCCAHVCHFDLWCCRVEWDELCVRWSQELCGYPPFNDSCFDSRQGWGALPVDANSTTVIGNAAATADANDPGFSCHSGEPGARGFGSVWFTFEATHTSARLHTCNSTAPADDSLLAVYRPGDASSPETACATLEEIACSDDEPACGLGTDSDACVTGLEPGTTYYVQLAAWTEDAQGVYRLDIESPCPDRGRVCPVGSVVWIDPPNHVVDARQPHSHDDASRLQGIDTFLVTAPVGADPGCWRISETNKNQEFHPDYPAGLARNGIRSVESGDGTYTISLARPITPGELTAITYTDDSGTASTGCFASHPGNVNGDGTADGADIRALVGVLNGNVESPWRVYSEDIDHSGRLAPADLLRVIDLLSAGGEFYPAWIRTSRPQGTGACP